MFLFYGEWLGGGAIVEQLGHSILVRTV